MDCYLPPITIHRRMPARALGEDLPYNIRDYDIELLWDEYGAGEGVIVGVADTGWPTVHAEKGDLKGVMLEGRDFTRSQHKERDQHGHGCVAPGDKILTSLCGLQEIKTFFDRAPGVAHFLPDGSTVKDVSRRSIYTLSYDDGKGGTCRRRVLAAHKLPYSGKVFRVECHGSVPLTLTPWHPVYVETSRRGGDQSIARKRADALQVGDRIIVAGDNPGVTDDYLDIPFRQRWVCVHCGHAARGGKRPGCRGCKRRRWHEGPTTQNIKLDEDLAYWLGLVVSAGHRMRSSPSVELTASVNNENGHLVDVFRELCLKLFGRAAKEYAASGRDTIRRTRLHDADVWRLLDRFDVPAGHKSSKTIVPELVTKSPTSVIFAFIAGILDGDGNQSSVGRMRIITGSKEFAEQLTLLYRMLGGRASWSEVPPRTRTSPDGRRYECASGYVVRLNALPGLVSQSRWKTVDESRRRRQLSVSVASIQEEDYDGVLYDLTVEGAHNYACNGQIVSNTHVCGTIAAQWKNGRGIAGVAHGIDGIYTAKVLGDSGSGSDKSVAGGIRWLVDKGCHIINLSLGSSFPSPTIQAACKYAADNGVILVAAAGNAGGGGDTVGYPAKWNNLAIAQGAIDANRKLAGFSSTGPAVDAVGPGVKIRSTYLNGNYAELSGTSMSTPWLTGVLALRLGYEIKNGNDPRQHNVRSILRLLKATADDLGRQGRDPRYGLGVPRVRDLLVHGIEDDNPDRPEDPDDPQDPDPGEPSNGCGTPDVRIPATVGGKEAEFIVVRKR